MTTRPIVVCLCGSTRFYEAFQRANFAETMAGKIVLSVGFYAGSPDQMVIEHGEGVGITQEEKTMLDELHLRKIDLSDEVLVLNVGGYIGESTSREIAYATKHGKRVRFLEKPPRRKPCDSCGEPLDNLLGQYVMSGFGQTREACHKCKPVLEADGYVVMVQAKGM